MRLLLFLFVLGVAIISCQKVKEQADEPIKFPRIIDTLPATDSFLRVDSMQDGLNWTYLFTIVRFDTSEITLSSDSLINYMGMDGLESSTPFEIIIDTTQVLVKEKKSLELPMPFVDGKNAVEPEREFYKAWPVFIINMGDSAHYMQVQDSRVCMIQEAKNQNGEWKPIEYWTHSWCGNSYYSFDIPPNYCAVTKIPIYKGNFETEMRLKMLNDTVIYYSKPFRGSINLSQFDTLAKWVVGKAF
jgi:hypothetical protein